MAHKHVENPTESAILEKIEDAIMGEIYEWFSFDSDEQELSWGVVPVARLTPELPARSILTIWLNAIAAALIAVKGTEQLRDMQ